jgi:hypothetical protein
MKYSADSQIVVPSRITKYRCFADNAAISLGRFTQLLADDREFREFHTRLLADSPFTAFRWETPAVTVNNRGNDYEFVLLNSPRLERAADRRAFVDQFPACQQGDAVIAFDNLGRNARMIVPCPTGDDSHYTHLASFLRGAPAWQVDRLWARVGSEMISAIGNSPRWLSTAGGGVAWLHIRIDQTPKYYGHAAYRSIAPPNPELP